MGKKYYVTLTDDEREYLTNIVSKGKTAGYRIKHAQILLKLDEIPDNKEWTIERIGVAYNAGHSSISNIAKRFVLENLEAALGRKEQVNRRRKIDGDIEAHIVAIACSEPPEGCERWTLQLIADKLVKLELIDSISATAIGTTLKKTNLNHGKKKSGVSQKQVQNS